MKLSGMLWFVAGALCVGGCNRPKANGDSAAATPAAAHAGNAAASRPAADPPKLFARALIRDRDAARVIELLKQHPKLATEPINGVAPLWLACESKSLPIVQAMVERGADVNARNADHHTVLWRAVQYGNLPVVKYLIEKGADPKALQDDGQTLLWAADSKEMAALLIAAGVDPLHKDDNKDTALHEACRKSSAPLVELLLDKGADIEAQGHWKMRPIHSAASSLTGDSRPVLNLLLRRGANIDSRGTEGHTALHECVIYNRFNAASLLLDRGADPNLKDDVGKTALDMVTATSQFDRAQVINLIVLHGGRRADGAVVPLIPLPRE